MKSLLATFAIAVVFVLGSSDSAHARRDCNCELRDVPGGHFENNQGGAGSNERGCQDACEASFTGQNNGSVLNSTWMDKTKPRVAKLCGDQYFTMWSRKGNNGGRTSKVKGPKGGGTYTAAVAAKPAVYKCDAGFTLSGTNCVKSVAATLVTAAVPAVAASCK